MHSNFTTAAVITMSACSFGGLLAFKQFVISQNILFLLAGFCLYGLSNTLFLFVISENGLARPMIFASAVGILLSTLAGIYFRENLSWVHFTATALVIGAVLLMLLHKPAFPNSDTSSKTPKVTITKESDHGI